MSDEQEHEQGENLEAELLALASVLKEHLRQWNRHGQWAVPRGRMPDAVRSQAPARPTPSGPQPAPGAPPQVIRGERPPPEAYEPAKPVREEGGIDPETVEALRTGTLTGTVGLMRIKALLGKCRRCRLHKSRLHIVFGEGSSEANVVFVGEAPGRDEDRQGAPFVGKAGQLLTRMIEAMGLQRDEVYICNIIKCRPPQNRDPDIDEVATCRHFLEAQVRAIQPAIIVALGRVAAQTLLDSQAPVGRMRGRWHKFLDVPLRVTYHPAYLLRNPDGKRPAWDDLQSVMAEMDRLKLPRRRKPKR
jgi:DNA polymerase